MAGPREEQGPEDGPPKAREGEDQGLADRTEQLVDRTEDLADRAIERFREEAHLPDVREEVGEVAGLFAAVHKQFLGWTLFFYVLTGVTGTLVALFRGLPDWYMHAAMYVVVLAFLVIYVKAYLNRARIARAVYALVTAGLMGFFAWVNLDLVDARLLVVGGEVVRRGAVPLLRLPAVMLVVSAVGLVSHWLVLARYRERRG
ncbi:MAG: hypothetical protein ACQEXJ_07420 [Myxococcota bacterium]